MNYTLKQLKEIMNRNGGNLYLSGTQITSLPEGLTVGGWLDLRNTQITSCYHCNTFYEKTVFIIYIDVAICFANICVGHKIG